MRLRETAEGKDASGMREHADAQEDLAMTPMDHIGDQYGGLFLRSRKSYTQRELRAMQENAEKLSRKELWQITLGAWKAALQVWAVFSGVLIAFIALLKLVW